VVELRKAAQERQMRFAPIDDIVVVIAARNRSAYDEEQHLSQWIRHLPGLPRIFDGRKVIEQQT
jgi:hypothetical protein